MWSVQRRYLSFTCCAQSLCNEAHPSEVGLHLWEAPTLSYLNHSKGAMQTPEVQIKMYHPTTQKSTGRLCLFTPPLWEQLRGRRLAWPGRQTAGGGAMSLPCAAFLVAQGYLEPLGGFVECTRSRRLCARAAEISRDNQANKNKMIRTWPEVRSSSGERFFFFFCFLFPWSKRKWSEWHLQSIGEHKYTRQEAELIRSHLSRVLTPQPPPPPLSRSPTYCLCTLKWQNNSI